ncbi:hypothetical protein I4I79_28535, partial [Pseudonocardia sp. KRD-176]|nr:hypothetical protein [Pseudonocardia oceani]
MTTPDRHDDRHAERPRGGVRGVIDDLLGRNDDDDVRHGDRHPDDPDNRGAGERAPDGSEDLTRPVPAGQAPGATAGQAPPPGYGPSAGTPIPGAPGAQGGMNQGGMPQGG